MNKSLTQTSLLVDMTRSTAFHNLTIVLLCILSFFITLLYFFFLLLLASFLPRFFLLDFNALLTLSFPASLSSGSSRFAKNAGATNQSCPDSNWGQIFLWK